MKVFVADNHEKGCWEKDYHWCDDGELLMFGLFATGNGNSSEISMCGMKSRKFTTYITVKDLKITKEFYKELIIDSIENAMYCNIDKNGSFDVTVGFGFHFNVNDIMNELLDKANQFNDNNKVRCFGRTLTKI